MPFPDDREFDAVLFDLDGTLVDTAPDMIAVLQDMLRDHGRDPVSFELGRRYVSNGAVGLLRLAFPSDEAVFNSPLHLEYLHRYEQRVCVESGLFRGMENLLHALEAAGRPWGIVTNKPERLTIALLEGLDLADRCVVAVCGDTMAERKPHPAPMHRACRLASLRAENTIYVGDAARDIEAGRAAGMGTIAVGYGYIPEDDDPMGWGADEVVATTADLALSLRKAVNLGHR